MAKATSHQSIAGYMGVAIEAVTKAMTDRLTTEAAQRDLAMRETALARRDLEVSRREAAVNANLHQQASMVDAFIIDDDSLWADLPIGVGGGPSGVDDMPSGDLGDLLEDDDDFVQDARILLGDDDVTIKSTVEAMLNAAPSPSSPACDPHQSPDGGSVGIRIAEDVFIQGGTMQLYKTPSFDPAQPANLQARLEWENTQKALIRSVVAKRVEKRGVCADTIPGPDPILPWVYTPEFPTSQGPYKFRPIRIVDAVNLIDSDHPTLNDVYLEVSTSNGMHPDDPFVPKDNPTLLVTLSGTAVVYWCPTDPRMYRFVDHHAVVDLGDDARRLVVPTFVFGGGCMTLRAFLDMVHCRKDQFRGYLKNFTALFSP